MGGALCHKQLALVYNKFNSKGDSKSSSCEFIRLMNQFMKFKMMKDCPHVPRVHGQEISLMSELVMDNDNRNLFSSKSLKVKKGSKNIPVETKPKLFSGI